MSKRKSYRLSVSRGNDVLLSSRFTALTREELEQQLWLIFKTDFDDAMQALGACKLITRVHNGLNHNLQVCCYEQVVDFCELNY